MQTLTRTRQHIRELAQANAFEELTHFIDSLEAQWLQAAPGECPAYLDAAKGHMLIDWETQIGKDLTAVLQAWIDACPNAYHPHVAMAFHAFDRATHIRSFAVAPEVTEDRWLGAAQACEVAAAHLLQAMNLSPRPVAAAICMIKICAHFDEPGWLSELFKGQPARWRPADQAEAQVRQEAAEHLHRYGLQVLAELPQALPALLPARDVHEFERPQDYWLLRAMAGFPNAYEAMQTYTAYLRPRWGGSYEEIDGLASGRLTDGWSEAHRNGLRWVILDDQFDLPESDEHDRIADWQAVFQDWSQRELRPLERATLLAREAAFRRYSLSDNAGAMALFSASVEHYPDQSWVGDIGEPFWSLAYLAVNQLAPDPQQTFKTVIERLCDTPNYAAACALRAAGHQFGLWGFERSGELADQWLATAAKRQSGRDGYGFDVLDVPLMLWGANLHPVAYFLYQRFAELELPNAPAALYDLHRGWLHDTPEQYLDEHKADYWLKRAAQMGCKVSKYNIARDRMSSGEDLSDPVARVEVWGQLLEALGDERIDGHVNLHLGILLRRYGEPVDHEQGLAYLYTVFDHAHDWVAARACAEIGLAWMEGQGAPRKNRFAAMQWVSRAMQIKPDSEQIQEIAWCIFNSHNRLLSFLTGITAFLFKGKFSRGELPPAALTR
ncbi:DUF4034 domain-containing protein [Pseudomonas entomophila]|uniref:DUF4034 domain-containing protein n=2 Tax=Pseudomonas entomophila TaxID=312306 RepID=Q1I2Y7_PSEE4|nr:DUF4034 domain-containing protein [Pseudomonas entomophila]WMW06313.1 DUF4034 domain-containing protein [Pseudomonas entomophila]CAK17999.1 conserved hypothetical protein [Pseudomonas entomophila L48]